MIEPKNNDGKLLHAFNKHRLAELVAKLISSQMYSENFGWWPPHNGRNKI